ncbi:hypothetical protein MKX03_017906 [Papaver bracteatum]|nr:hypothetical protein MKX03_017906 [Papaver bracteatum]
MRGCLCVSYEYEEGADLLVLKRNQEGTASSSNPYNAKYQYYKSRIWSKELHIGVLDVNREFNISGLTKEGKVIFRRSVIGCLTQYNLISTITTVIWKNDHTILAAEQVISHVNSFVSLKALGEDIAKNCTIKQRK